MKNHEYREIIEKFARERINKRVSNGAPAHASVLLETMFKHAVAEMRIFTKELNGSVFGEQHMIDAATRFLGKPYSSMKILLQEGKDEAWAKDHPLFKAIAKMGEPHGKVEVVNASGSYAENDANHFAVMDNDGYRFEFDHEKCKAVANFNEPKVAKDLISAFDKAFELSKKSKENAKIFSLNN